MFKSKPLIFDSLSEVEKFLEKVLKVNFKLWKFKSKLFNIANLDRWIK